jgi:hypothetical protein
MQPNANDQHVYVRFPLNNGANTVVIRLKNDFGLALSNDLPQLGSTSRGLRVLSESWNESRTQLVMNVSGIPNTRYELSVWNPSQISSVEGAVLTKDSKVEISIPGSSDTYTTQKVTVNFQR